MPFCSRAVRCLEFGITLQNDLSETDSSSNAEGERRLGEFLNVIASDVRCKRERGAVRRGE